MKGLDHASSLEPEGLKRMVKHIRDFELAKGDGIKKITRGEQIVSEALGRTNFVVKEDKCLSGD
jgi:N-acetylneuraminate synthase